MTANVNVTKVLVRRGNTAQNAAYTGINGEITVDTQAFTIRIHDGTTVGGTVINAAGAAGSYSNTNTAAYLQSQNITSANIGGSQTFANANAAVQATAINSLNANIGAYQTYANSNAATQSTSINNITANIGAFQTYSNATFGTSSYANANVKSYLAAFDGNILPSANVTYSLGDATHQWRDLWVSNNTIYIGNTPIRVDGGTLLVNNAPITAGSTYGNSNVAAYLPTYVGNLSGSRAQLTNSLDFMYGGFPYMGWQLDGSDTLKLRTNIASGDYTNDAILINRQSLEVNVVAQLTVGNVVTTNGVFWSNGESYSSSTTGNVNGVTGAINFVANSSGDGNGYSTLQLIPDNALTGSDQYLIIDPTAPGHIHIRAGGIQDSSSAELIIGGEVSNFKVGSGISPTIYINSDNKQWTFGTDGSLTFPSGGNLIFDSSAVSVVDGVSNITTGNLITTNGVYWSNGSAYSSGTAYGNTEVAAYLVANPQPGTYSNVNVEAYIGSNIGSYQTFANANAATQATSIDTINANIGAFQTYSNATFGGSSYGNTNVAAYLTGNIIAGNINATQYNFANGVNILSTVGAGSYGNTEVAAYLMTWPNADINILDTTTANITTLRSNNFSTANAVISGGYISALTNASIISSTVVTENITNGNVTTLRATNFGTGNAVISGGYISAMTNAYVTLSRITNFSTGNAVLAGGYINSFTNVYATTGSFTNLDTSNILVTGGYISSLANATVSGNVTAGNLIGYGSNTSIIAGAYTSTFDTLGNVVLPNIYVTGNSTAAGIAPGYAPNRPAFRVYGFGTTNNLTTTQNTNGVLNSNNWAVDYEQGSYLNGTTGVFTVPVAGLYNISVIGRNSGYTSGISQLVCVKNYTGSSQVLTMLEFASNSSMNHAGTSTVARLVAGDTLAIRVTSGEINFDVNDSWSVTYIG